MTRSLPLSATTTKLNISSNEVVVKQTPERSIKSSSDSSKQEPELLASSDKVSGEDLTKDESSSIVGRSERNGNCNVLESGAQKTYDYQEPSYNNRTSWLKWRTNSDGRDHIIKQAQAQSTHSGVQVLAAGNSKQIYPAMITQEDETKPCTSGAHNVMHPTKSTTPWSSSWNLGNMWSRNNIGNDSHKLDDSQPIRVVGASDLANRSNQQVPSSSHGWAFWSKSTGHGVQEVPVPDTEERPLALSGDTSQTNSENAVIGTQSLSITKNRLGKQQRLNPVEEHMIAQQENCVASETTGSLIETAILTESLQIAGSVTGKTISVAENLLLPSFSQTYAPAPENFTILQQLGQWIYGQPPAPKQLSIIKNPCRIRKALAIGVHGYFPMPIIQTVLGRPTGTSIKFAEAAANAIHRFTRRYGYSALSVDKIALEGEGKIEERIETLCMCFLGTLFP